MEISALLPLSICTGFLLEFLSTSNLIFSACVVCKNQVRNRQKIKFKNQFREIEILKNQLQIDKELLSFKTYAATILRPFLY